MSKESNEMQENEKLELSKRIRYVRNEIAHQSQNDFGYSLYVSRVYINQLENAKFKNMPSPAFLQRICNQYGVSDEWIRYGKEPILQRDLEKLAMDYQTKHVDIPRDQLYPSETWSHELLTHLEFELQDIFHPERLSAEQYGILMETYTTLSRPLLELMSTIRKTEPKNKPILPELYKEYERKADFCAKACKSKASSLF